MMSLREAAALVKQAANAQPKYLLQIQRLLEGKAEWLHSG
jgi:hypothetical protein